MYSLQHKFPFDDFISTLGFLFGFIFGVISFIMTVLVVAIFMKWFFSDLSFKRCSFYSLVVNLLSSSLSIPAAYFFSNTSTHTFNSFQDFVAGLFLTFSTSSLFFPLMIISVLGWWLVIAFIITLISEFIFYKLVLKSKSIQKVAGFTVISSLATYAITPILSFTGYCILFFISWMLINT